MNMECNGLSFDEIPWVPCKFVFTGALPSSSLVNELSSRHNHDAEMKMEMWLNWNSLPIFSFPKGNIWSQNISITAFHCLTFVRTVFATEFGCDGFPLHIISKQNEAAAWLFVVFSSTLKVVPVWRIILVQRNQAKLFLLIHTQTHESA